MLRYLLVLLASALFFACQDDDDFVANPDCGDPIIITGQPLGPSSDNFSLAAATVEGLCLTVQIGASGCSSDGWTLDLLTDGSVAESFPTQTSARLVFDDQVPGGVTCQAFFTETFSFDLSPYLDAGALPTNLTLTGLDTVQTVVFID